MSFNNFEPMVRTIKVLNRSTGNVCYELPELNTRRVFNFGESKMIPEKELEALYQTDGGLQLLKEMLLVFDKNWVKEHWDAPIEYWWTPERIQQAMIEDDVELFKETLEYAPEGVIDFIKMFAWQMPLSDLNKVEALKEATGFDAVAASSLMSVKKENLAPRKTTRLRKEED